MILGFLFIPPLLWWAAVSVYSDHIFSKTKDENGYLRVWGRWVEVLVTVLIIANAIAWWAGLTYGTWILGPGIKELLKGMGEALDAARGMARDAGL